MGSEWIISTMYTKNTIGRLTSGGFLSWQRRPSVESAQGDWLSALPVSSILFDFDRILEERKSVVGVKQLHDLHGMRHHDCTLCYLLLCQYGVLIG